MSITKAAVVTKINSFISWLDSPYKVTASDINELRRASDDTIDYVLGLGASLAKTGGVFACDGTGPAQTVAQLAEVEVDQFTGVQDGDNFGTTAGDSVLTIPLASPGIYLVTFYVNYATNAKNGDIFKWRVTKNGTAVPGLCSRVPHERSGDSSYRAGAALMLEAAAGDELAVQCEGFSLSTSRSFTLLHGSLTAWRRLSVDP